MALADWEEAAGTVMAAVLEVTEDFEEEYGEDAEVGNAEETEVLVVGLLAEYWEAMVGVTVGEFVAEIQVV